LHRIFPSFPGHSNRSYSFKLSFKHFHRNSCVFHPLDMSRPLKPFQFDTCYKVRFTVQFIQFLVVSALKSIVTVNLDCHVKVWAHVAGSRHVVTRARSARGRDGEQAELLLCAAHPEGVPLRGLTLADVPASRRPLAQVGQETAGLRAMPDADNRAISETTYDLSTSYLCTSCVLMRIQ
jgi:hypothetical protein